MMMIVTEDNHAVQITLREGNVVACRAGLKEGREAIDLLKTVKAGRYFFNKVSPNLTASGPSFQIGTDELLKELTGKGLDESGQTMPPAKLSELKKAVEEELKRVIGPIAAMVCEDHFEGLTTGGGDGDLVKMLDQITMEVEERKRDLFKERLTDRLKQIDMQQIVSGHAKSFH